MEQTHISDPVKVLMFGWELPPFNSGGLGVACEGLTKSLSKLGTQISFVMPKNLGVNYEHMEILCDGMEGEGKVKKIAVNSLLKAYLTAHGYKKLLIDGKYVDARVFGDTLYEEVLRFGALGKYWGKHTSHQLIHAHDWLTFPAGMEAAKSSGHPLVAHIHATEYDRAGEDVDTRIAEIESEGLRKADRVIAVSELTKNTVMKRYGIDSTKIQVIHNGTTWIDSLEDEVDDRNLLPGMKVVLFVGRLTYMKGAEFLLQAAKQVIKYDERAVFVFAGSGDKQEELIIESTRLGISNRVIFAGFVRGLPLKQLFQRADVFVMPSRSEPFGIVGLEALASKRPVILSRQSGISEVIHHALKVDFWDTERLADLILSVLRYPELKEELSINGHEQMKQLSWDAAANKTHALYHQLLHA